MDKVKELVVTVRVAGGEIVKIAALKASGERRELTEQEFADLAANGEEESLVAALEEAYAAGAEDSSDASGAEGVRILWDAAARQRLRSSVRRLVLGRALARMAATPAPRTAKSAQRTSPTRKGSANARGSHAEH
jgi:hypothetical protein